MIARAVGAGLLCLALLACGPMPGPSPATAPSPSGSPVGPTTEPSATAVSASGSGVRVDASLLEILPDDVDGVPIVPDAENAAGLAADPTLAADVEALALALAVDQAAGAENLAIVNVVRLRPAVLGEAFFRQWRDSYDEAACAPAGGVTGHAEAEIDGRQAFIGSCSGGAFTYHAIHGEDVIVSITSVGEGRLGEAIMENLEG
ncbi:MAG TPA: hypothetical protein VFO78_11380 [Candidatus Limnocylindrales bacterium]|nr:hypothetical protein [Candidatus Limnocylindrales bacterium]